MNFTTELKGHTVEYFDDGHVYLVDGVQVPSITQILGWKFGNRFDHVDKEVLRKAAEEGTKVHAAIEKYCTEGIEADLPEVQNFKLLQKWYKFSVKKCEVPVLLHWIDGTVMAAGRLDLLIDIDGHTGIADIKRTSALDKAYLTYQLNLYHIAYTQTYGEKVEVLRGIHLKNDVRKVVRIPFKRNETFELLEEYRKENEIE